MGKLDNIKRSAHIFTMLFRYLRLSNHPNADYRQLKSRFTGEMLKHLNFEVTIRGATPAPANEPVIYVCNHIGYMDIPLIMNLLPQASFVSKQEVTRWPLIGTAARKINTIFVKRESKNSRSQTRQAITEALAEHKMQVVVFPSGTTSLGKADKWRKGIFEIAQENNVRVIPLRLTYFPLRDVAYIGQDNFVLHLIQLAGIKKIEATLELGEAVEIKNPIDDCKKIKSWCEQKMSPVADENSLQPERSLGSLALE